MRSVPVHPAAGVDALTAAGAGDEGLCLARGVAGLRAQTLRADRDNRRLLQGKIFVDNDKNI